MLNITGHRKIYFAVAAVLVGSALLAVLFLGFKQGVDFSGGSLWQFSVSDRSIGVSDVNAFFVDELQLSEARVNYDETNEVFLVRLPELSETKHQELIAAAGEKLRGFEELSFQSIGPSVGAELRRNAILAIIFVILGISLYIAFAFRKASYPISSWKYGFVTILTLFHDVAIPTVFTKSPSP